MAPSPVPLGPRPPKGGVVPPTPPGVECGGTGLWAPVSRGVAHYRPCWWWSLVPRVRRGLAGARFPRTGAAPWPFVSCAHPVPCPNPGVRRARSDDPLNSRWGLGEGAVRAHWPTPRRAGGGILGGSLQPDLRARVARVRVQAARETGRLRPRTYNWPLLGGPVGPEPLAAWGGGSNIVLPAPPCGPPGLCRPQLSLPGGGPGPTRQLCVRSSGPGRPSGCSGSGGPAPPTGGPGVDVPIPRLLPSVGPGGRPFRRP